ncbi:MAG: T9SS type A sorting domain-containing protein [Chitinophagales bacterium]
MYRNFFMLLFLFSQLAFGQLTHIPLENEGEHSFFDAYFLNETVGFVVGVDWGESNSRGVIFRTSDGGETWSRSFVDNENSVFFSVYFVNDSIGYVGAEHGYIYKSTDGGENFFRYRPSLGFSFLDYMDIYMWENQGLFLGTSSIFKTYDDGASLHRVYDDNRLWQKVQFINQNVAYALGFYLNNGDFDGNTYNNVFIKTTDQGETWEVVADSLDYSLRSFHFLNEATAFACSYRDEIYKSIDAGQSWEIVASSPEGCASLFEITFFNEEVGYAVGGTEDCPANAVLWETKDGGENWQKILELEGEGYFRKVVRVSDNSGLIFAKESKIFKILSDDITEIKELKLGNRLDIQASPNPFQENFSLQFDLPKTSIVNIELYTIEGQKQTILTSKRLETGLQSFEISPDFSSASNIYFIEVTIDGEKHIEKVIQYK